MVWCEWHATMFRHNVHSSEIHSEITLLYNYITWLNTVLFVIKRLVAHFLSAIRVKGTRNKEQYKSVQQGDKTYLCKSKTASDNYSNYIKLSFKHHLIQWFKRTLSS